MTRPRVLLVGRTRFRFPLDAATRRKFDALGRELDLRVVGSSADGAVDDGTFRLAGAVRPRSLDGVAFHALLPFRIARALREFEPDAILVQDANNATAAVVAGAVARRRVPVVVDVHGDWRTATRTYGSRARRVLSPVADRLAALGLRRAAAVRTVSPFTSMLARELGVEPAAEFPAFMDLEPFVERSPAPLPRDPRVLFVGALELYKGVDVLAAAWPDVRARVPEAELRIVGKGPRESIVDGLTARRDRELSPEQIAAALDESTCLVLPSRREGMGRVVVEALLRGRPVVGTRGGGIEDIVRDGENGLLVPQDDARSLADALVRVLTDRTLAERLAADARASATRWLATPEEYAARMRQLVEHALRR